MYDSCLCRLDHNARGVSAEYTRCPARYDTRNSVRAVPGMRMDTSEFWRPRPKLSGDSWRARSMIEIILDYYKYLVSPKLYYLPKVAGIAPVHFVLQSHLSWDWLNSSNLWRAILATKYLHDVFRKTSVGR